MAPNKRSFDAMQCGAASQCQNTQKKNRSSTGAENNNRSVTFSSQAPMSQFNNGNETALVSAQLPDNEKLVNTKEFQITSTTMGRYLACGEKVHLYPEPNEFRIRILNMDYKNGRGMRNFVEFSKASLDELICHASEIERLVGEKLLHRNEVFQHLGLSVWIVPDIRAGCNVIEFRSDNCFSQMVFNTFRKMINFKDQVDREYFVFERKLKRDKEIYKNMLNMFAYLTNENRPNTAGVKEPPETNQRAIINTCNTLWKQIGKLVDKNANTQ
ncbi:uncharacterized protein LOC100680428 [Nasonia vitripennis]|uniref:Uncharacterized protein n=1 Tax=Nasonia vitripennis TaxID=7425 RepID=A0A7M7H3T8_NASVI|nr:uncharacterized protein LOC100680428 [Nasonia vitripennis]